MNREQQIRDAFIEEALLDGKVNTIIKKVQQYTCFYNKSE